MINVEADDVAVRVEVDHESLDDFARLRARRVVQFDIKAVGAGNNAASWLVFLQHSLCDTYVFARQSCPLGCNNGEDP
jgi:hypothetical protein